MGWLDNFLKREAAQAQGGNKIFWKDGEVKIIRFLFNFAEETVIGCGKHYYANKYYYCPAWEAIYVQNIPLETAGCPICKAMGGAPSTNLVMLAIDMTTKEDGVPKGKVGYIEQARFNFWAWLIEYMNQGNPMNDKSFYVKRSGARQGTTFFITPYAPSPLDMGSINWPIQMSGSQEDYARLQQWVRQEIDSKTLQYDDLEKIVNEARAMGFGYSQPQAGIVPPQQVGMQQVYQQPQMAPSPMAAPAQPMMQPQPVPQMQQSFLSDQPPQMVMGPPPTVPDQSQQPQMGPPMQPQPSMAPDPTMFGQPPSAPPQMGEPKKDLIDW